MPLLTPLVMPTSGDIGEFTEAGGILTLRCAQMTPVSQRASMMALKTMASGRQPRSRICS